MSSVGVQQAGPKLQALSAARTSGWPLVGVAETQTVFSVGEEMLSRQGKTISANGHFPRLQLSMSNGRVLRTEVFSVDVGNKGGVTHGASAPTGQNQFSVDYTHGTITLGDAIRENVSLTVKYDPVVPGSLTAGSFSNFDLTTLHPALPKGAAPMVYTSGVTIGQFFADNLATHPSAPFFITDSEAAMELVYANNIKVRPFDNRYFHATAQFLGGSSFGPIQMTLQRYVDPVGRRPFDRVLNADIRSLTDLTKDWDVGVAIGGVFHRQSISDLQANGKLSDPICSPCNTEQWERAWSTILREFNTGGPEYMIDAFLNPRNRRPNFPAESFDFFKNDIVRRSRVYRPAF